MVATKAAVISLVLTGFVTVAAWRRDTPCPDADYSKCDDDFDDCCLTWEFGESHYCRDGYKVVETSASCTRAQDGVREYNCVPQYSSCSEWVEQHSYHHCEVTDEEEEDWYAKMLTGSIVGAVVAIILIVIASMPVCCGVAKENKSTLCCMGTFVGIIAAVCNFVPLIAALVATTEAVDHHCDKCNCTDEEREDAKHIFGFWGAIIGYMHGMGFLVVVLATTAEVLVCCMCCPCCGPLKTYRDAQKLPQGPAVQVPQVQGNVVGAPQC